MVPIIYNLSCQTALLKNTAFSKKGNLVQICICSIIYPVVFCKEVPFAFYLDDKMPFCTGEHPKRTSAPRGGGPTNAAATVNFACKRPKYADEG